MKLLINIFDLYHQKETQTNIFYYDKTEMSDRELKIFESEKQKILNLCSDETIIKNNILKLLSSLLLADNSFVVNDTILSSIINNISVPINERLIIFNKNSNKYDIPFIQNFLTNLGGFYLEITDKNTKAKVKKSSENLNLLNVLVNKGYISSYTDIINFYRVNHKRK